MLVIQSKKKATTKKTDQNTKITEIEKNHNHDQYITTSEINKLTAENFVARLKQADLVTRTDFDDKLRSLNHKIKPNKLRHLPVENELKKQKTTELI